MENQQSGKKGLVEAPPVGVWQPVLFAAMAGGMGWGIRGQYGHETGAMIAGLLVSLTLILLLCPKTHPTAMIRAAAWGTLAMGIGGSMTYGQTLGLTQNPGMIGNWEALRWGLFGCLVKGGIWIGFAGTFLGMGLSGTRYRWKEMWVVMLALVGAYYIGHSLLNSPFDPASRKLPHFYFSASWYWEPENPDPHPREEAWGGLLFALVVLVAYVGGIRKDRLARNMAFWGMLGGALGFPAGQSLQAFHAWNPEVFKRGIWVELDQYMNWWNNMETTYGAVMAAVLGLGLWLNRSKIRPETAGEDENLPLWAESILLFVHFFLLLAVVFVAIRAVDSIYDLGLIMVIIPVVGVSGGRWWPYFQILPLTLIPIAGKTVRQIVYQTEQIGVLAGWFFYLVLPLAVSLATLYWVWNRSVKERDGIAAIRVALLVNAWTYFLLNYAFFEFPWPWAQWTSRTPNAIVYTICVFGLTILTGFARRSDLPDDSESATTAR